MRRCNFYKCRHSAKRELISKRFGLIGSYCMSHGKQQKENLSSAWRLLQLGWHDEHKENARNAKRVRVKGSA